MRIYFPSSRSTSGYVSNPCAPKWSEMTICTGKLVSLCRLLEAGYYLFETLFQSQLTVRSKDVRYHGLLITVSRWRGVSAGSRESPLSRPSQVATRLFDYVLGH